ncbi:MAG: hypothetical protein Q9222_004544 [Ikaeria aurantiellina]
MAFRRFPSSEDNEILMACQVVSLTPTRDCRFHRYFRVQNIIGKGLGCVAVDDLSPGTLILMEKPLLSISNVEDRWSRQNRDDLQREIQRLQTNRRLHELRNLFSRRHGTAAADRDRFEINNFQMSEGDDDGPSDQGVFPQAARFNHSCLPNAWFNWNPNLQPYGSPDPPEYLTLYTTKIIRADEEIVFNYRNKNWSRPRAERQRELNQDYGFLCDCMACRPNGVGDLAEKRRARMRQDLNAIIRYHSDQDHTREMQFEALQSLVSRLEREQLVYPQMADCQGKIADWWFREMRRCQQGSSAWVDAEVCRSEGLKAARRRLQIELICLGEDAPEIRNTIVQIPQLA